MEIFISAGIIIIIGLMGFVVVKLLARPATSNSDDTARAQAQADAYKQQLDAAQLEIRATRAENNSLLQERTQLAEREALAKQTTTTTLQRLEEATVKIQQLSDQHQQAINRAEKAELEVRHHQDLCQKETAKLKAKIEEHEALQKAHNDKCTEFATVEGQLKNLQKQLDDRESALKKEIEQLQQTFKVSVNELVDQKARALKEDSKQSVAELLTPVKEKLTEFSTRVETLNADSAKQHGSLAEHLVRVEQLNQTLSQEASALAQALRGDAKVMGDWGEVTLERVLEASGLQEGLHYRKQEVVRNDDGTARTDITLTLPQNRTVVIDSKVSLKSYVEYCNAPETDQPKLAKALLDSLQAHIEKLATTEYHKKKEGSVEFTFMFVPHDPIFNLAVKLNPALVSTAYRKRVLLVTPSTLVVALKVVTDLWQREEIAKNHQELVRLAGNIYNKLSDALGDLHEIGTQITKLSQVHGKAMGRLSEGNGNVIRTAHSILKIADREVKSNKRIDNNYPDLHQRAINSTDEPDIDIIHTDDDPEPDGTPA